MALIALGVGGGIGAYKAVEVVRGLQKRGHEVVAVMTRNARRFVGPLTFEAITRHRVFVDQFAAGANADRRPVVGDGSRGGEAAKADIEHISLASSIDLLLVAPATANVIGKFANGIADDFLSSLYIATKAPVLLAPSMNTNMLEHPAVQQNLDRLAAQGVRFVDAGDGYLACGWIGKGRLAEPEDIVESAESVLSPRGPLSGARVLITAGGTREPLDPVRFIGNRSSGKMGYALAAVARSRGAQVTLVTGPVSLQPPIGVELVTIATAAEMRDAVASRAGQQDVIIMAAAVADYAPATPAAQKIHKDSDSITVTLVKTPDIIGEIGATRAGADIPVLVAFAAETERVIEQARKKLVQKQVDVVVANDVSRADAAFESDANEVTLVSAEGDEQIPLQPKTAVAGRILDRVEQLLRKRTPALR